MKDVIPLLISGKAEGWCTQEKGEVLYDLVHTYNASTIVEIGTFGGKSIAVFALALKSLGRGIVFGIDPWKMEPCLEGVNDKENDSWWSRVNWDSIIKHYFELFQKHDLLEYHAHLRKKDEECLDYFKDGSIDIIHIDSNHSEELACQTVKLWWPKIKSGAVIIMDDIDWFGPSKAVDLLKEYGASEIANHVNFGVYIKA